MSASEPLGWAFVVGRGREVGYRLLLAPGFVVDNAGGGRLVATVQGEVPDDAPPQLTTVVIPDVGRVDVVYRTRRLTRADLDLDLDLGSGRGPDQSDAGVLDGAGRPLVLAFGFICPRERIERVDDADLTTVWLAAVATYRRFHAGESDFDTERSSGFALVSAVDPSSTGAVGTRETSVYEKAGPEWDGDPLASYRSAEPRRTHGTVARPVLWLVGTTAVALAFAAGALALVHGRPPSPTPPIGTVHLSACSTARDQPGQCRPDTVDVGFTPVVPGSPTRMVRVIGPATTMPPGPSADEVVEVGSYRLGPVVSAMGWPCRTEPSATAVTVAGAAPVELKVTCVEPTRPVNAGATGQR